jgi:hypothetical protein
MADHDHRAAERKHAPATNRHRDSFQFGTAATRVGGVYTRGMLQPDYGAATQDL